MKKLIFYNEEEMNDYYNQETNTYAFWDDEKGTDCDIVLRFDLETNASILCHNLDCIDIKVESITANDIEGCSITANDIICHDIDATSIKSDRIILINYGSIDCLGSIRCPYIRCERLSNW